MTNIFHSTGEPPQAAASKVAAARRDQWCVFWVAVAILAASFVLQCGADGRVRLPLVETELPQVCWSRRYLGIECPTCGLTRSFVSLAHRDVAASVHYQPLGLVLFAVVAAQIPYRLVQLRRLSEGRLLWRHPLLKIGVWLLAAGLLGQWLWRIFD